MTIEELRSEQASRAWRNHVFKSKGKKCAVCDANENLEIHHVLPVVKGGTNDLNNLLVVCQMHHKQLYGKIFRNTINNGRRKTITYEKALPILKRCFNCEIGKRECTELLGFSANNHSGIYTLRKMYEKEFGKLNNFYNCIDLREAAPKRVYKDGNCGRPSKAQ